MPNQRKADLIQSRNMTLRLPGPQLSRYSLLFLQSALRFLSAWLLVRKQMFCPSSISETRPHTLTFLCQNWRKKPPNTKQKTILKPQKLTQNKIAIFSSSFTFLSHCSERSSWYFLFLFPLSISFSIWSLFLWQFCLAAIQQACPVSSCTSI